MEESYPKARFPEASKGVIVWEWVKQKIKMWWQKYGSMGINLSAWVENIVEKGEIARHAPFAFG